MKYRIVEHPAIEVVGWALRTVTTEGQNLMAIPNFWGQCQAEGKISSLTPFCGPKGLIGLCAEMDPKSDEFTYVVGVEGSGAKMPAGTRALTVPAATYVVFESIGAMPHAIQSVWKQAFSQWFPSSGYEHAGSADFEVYPVFPPSDPRGDMTSVRFYSEVWIPIRKTQG